MKLLKNKFVLFVSFLLVLTCIGGVYAYMFKQTDIVDNQFIPAVVKCEVNEDYDGHVKSSITVKNTGNIDAYLRLRLVSYWIDSNGNIVPKASEMPTFSVNSGWIKGSDDTYYYNSIVSPNNSTGNLSSSIQLKESSEGYKQVVEVFAEAIQAKPKDAVTQAWPVNVNNEILSLK